MTTRGPHSPVRPPVPAGRPRDAAASKQALLGAAQLLFGQRGFESTTTRDIGDTAGVDPALIARYFGSKADLYIAAVVAEAQGERPPPDFERLSDMAEAILARTDESGLGPVTQALIRSDTPEEIRQASQAYLVRRLVVPVEAEMRRRRVQQPQIKAEIVVSALLGINLGRALGWFSELHDVPRTELVGLISALLDSGPGPGPQSLEQSSRKRRP